MIRILVPLLCHSVPIVKVHYATEQAETKQLFWAVRLCFPQRHEGGGALPPGQKENKKTKKTEVAEELATTFVQEALKKTTIYKYKY